VGRIRVSGRWMECSLVTLSVGSVPAWQLPCQGGATFGYDEMKARPTLTLPSGAPIHLAGPLAGHTGLMAAMASGRHTAEAALGRLGHRTRDEEPIPSAPEAEDGFLPTIAAHPKGR